MHYIYSKMLKFICRDSRVFAHNAIAILFTNTLQFSEIKKCFSVSIIIRLTQLSIDIDCFLSDFIVIQLNLPFLDWNVFISSDFFVFRLYFACFAWKFAAVYERIHSLDIDIDCFLLLVSLFLNWNSFFGKKFVIFHVVLSFLK